MKRLKSPLSVLVFGALFTVLLVFEGCSRQDQPQQMNKVQSQQASRAEPQEVRQEQTQEIMRQQMEQLRAGQELEIEGTSIAAVQLIPELYERRDFRLAWTRRDNIEELLRLIRGSYAEGLDPDDYHYDELMGLSQKLNAQGKLDSRSKVALDILLTDSLVRLGYHINFGKVNPKNLDSNWNFKRELEPGRDPVDIVQAAIASDSLEKFIADEIPEQIPYYHKLKEALAHYRKIKDAGGWPGVPNGPTLKPGMKDSRVESLRRRLEVTGDLKVSGPRQLDSYDEALEKAVIRFQGRHGLDADGLVGKNTFDALNAPVDARIDQIRANLERARWVFKDIGSDYIIVDIAGFQVYLVRNGETVWNARAQVGKPFRETPVFRSTMKYLVFNPTWTVPPTILAEDILPQVKRDPDYLRRKNIDVINRKGKVINPKSINWSKYKARGFPYQLRQGPGPSNALGRVKFMFPNQHLVYLHDTPSRSLFDRTERTFSSGCIRTEDPLTLAELLLADKSKWNQESIQKVIDSKQTRTVRLTKPLSVMLLYWTVDVDDQGIVNFKKDVYGRDNRIIAALHGDFNFSAPGGMPAWYQSKAR